MTIGSAGRNDSGKRAEAMQVFIVTHSSTYDSRAEAAGGWFCDQGDTVAYLFSDFDHLKRAKRPLSAAAKTDGRTEKYYLPMHPYQKNLSLGRISSIRKFARDVERWLDHRLSGLQGEKGTDWTEKNVLLWFLIPANSFAEAASRLKKKYGVRIVLDIIDLWPESIPRPELQRLPPMKMWAAIRDRHLSCADLVFTECSLYQTLLRLPEERTCVLPWFKEEKEGEGENNTSRQGITVPAEVESRQVLSIVYLGAVNNIIDISLITDFLCLVRRRLQEEQKDLLLHIIGEGEHKQDFLTALQDSQIPLEDHGAVYDEKTKAQILAPCRFGLNFMKPAVRVGLTMKSIDYLSFGIPILNNIPDDSWRLVEQEKIGINVDRVHPETAAEEAVRLFLHPEEWEAMRRRARHSYEEKFTRKAFRKILAAGFFRSQVSESQTRVKSPEEDNRQEG